MCFWSGLFRRKFKRAFFQAFIEQDKAAGFPAQEFDAVAFFVDKDEYISTHGIMLHFTGDNPAQSIKAFAHIGGVAVQKIAVRAQRKHKLKSGLRSEVYAEK